ncbi:LOW QUALITY PROTEIN: A kinase (PRKA) anchor protein 1b [Megalops cyprinoides]|uniref:LOW QUALITY PROTEIN: A kinase (PRKA) anchor protein 1b n=1 Tax=Megalops cyprinoides TaxID=118141 RepID=UPI00186522C7|nr:LOW QUALITY PROTEIN: A kinase (PRKA) anchor protein 1b [Megalops cyprinoides]
MPLRFRSFVPYTLPGVLALIGWWWYISRKKGRIASHDKEEGPAAAGLLSQPSEGSNGMVERGAHCRTSRGRPRAKEEVPVEGDVTTETRVPFTAAATSPRTEGASSLPSRGDTPADPGAGTAGQKTTDTLSESAQEVSARGGPEEGVASRTARQVPPRAKEAAAPSPAGEPGTPPRSEQDPATKQGERSPPPPSSQTPDAPIAPVAARLSEAVRPEPEGEVAADKTSVPFAERLQAGPAEPAPKTVRLLPPCPPPSRILTATASVETGPVQPTEENGLPGDVAESSGSTGEIERLAAGLITEVISAATQQVLTAGREEEEDRGRGPALSPGAEQEEQRSGPLAGPSSSSTPLANGRPCALRDQADEDRALTPEKVEHLLQDTLPPAGHVEAGTGEVGALPASQLSDSVGDSLNGCLVPPAWESPEETADRRRAAEKSTRPALSKTRPEATPPSVAKLQAEDGVAAAEDSGCSTCQSEDGVSSEDLLHSTGLSSSAPDSREDLLHVSGISQDLDRRGEGPGRRSLEAEAKGLNGAGIGNGSHVTCETEADHSGGSDVNSMDSVDSGCTLGVGDSQRSASGGQPPPQSTELIIWEIEVPKHLVGRLIGKQGRYVSFLKQSSGAKIYISTLPYTQEFQICHIEGTQQQVDKALGLIGKKFKDLDLTNLYAPPPLPLTLPSLPMTSWLLLPNGVTVEVIVVNIVSAGHVFVQQHTHPTYHALRSLDQQMFLCYSQPGTPALPSPAEVGVICAAPAVEGAWWRAQVISFYKDSNEVEIRYVDYGGYDRVKIDTLRQIRSDFVTLPFQGAEVLLDNIAPLPGEERFSAEANSALEELTRGVALLAQVTNYDNNTGLPLVQMWNMVGDELVSVNRTLAERGFGSWVDSF